MVKIKKLLVLGLELGFLFKISYRVDVREQKCVIGLILNRGNLENRPFFQKVQGNFSNIYPCQGTVKESKLFSSLIIFIDSMHGCSQSDFSICCQ